MRTTVLAAIDRYNTFGRENPDIIYVLSWISLLELETFIYFFLEVELILGLMKSS